VNEPGADDLAEKVMADSRTWLGFLAGARNLLWALMCATSLLSGAAIAQAACSGPSDLRQHLDYPFAHHRVVLLESPVGYEPVNDNVTN